MNERTQSSPQAQASDPRSSAWVSANAGSGKTTVLVRRVIRLLLDGVPPGRILCLTYTKAAAAHMANKVLETLSAWVQLDDDALDQAISEIEPGKPDAARRAAARRLFAAALETPGGLKVQTIHAFCDRVLHMFPVEADAPAGFDVLDELGESDLLEAARLDVLLEAGREPASALGRALAHCIEISGDDTIEKVIAEAVRERGHLHAFDYDTARTAMLSALGLEADDTHETISSAILSGGTLPAAEWQATALSLQAFGGNAAKTGAALLQVASAQDAERLDAYLSVFFTAKGEPKADGSFGAKGDLEKIAAVRDWLFEERERLVPLLQKLRAATECDRSCALLTLAASVFRRYETLKRQRGVLDFADLVSRTVELLERESSAWVHYKLDGGIDHILVDEAQDTSPAQWRIVAKLAEEFFAGKGASERNRTIFAVGDEKQSIFSFQGADPQRFAEMRNHFAGLIGATGATLEQPRLRLSYRSTTIVLGAVDKVFEKEDARKGLSAQDTQGPLHEAVRRNAPGMVEIWKPVKARNEAGEDEGWDKPFDTAREASAPVQLAQQIAKAIRHWTGGGLSIGDRKNGEMPRAVTPGDIIILVQSRGALFDAILRTLKKENIPVAGADRLRLTENIAVMDLIALGDALLLSEDDLALACVLKSPLFHFSDDDLFALCHGRSDTLWQSLAASSEPRYADAAHVLSRWQELAAHLRPFDFYSRVLGRDGGRKKVIARLGAEAADALDEFLAAALSYESYETPSLHGFLSFLRRADAEIKRDLEAEGSAVRVMTVHGVKGLEAPVVILADTTSLPHASKDPKVVPVARDNAPEGSLPALIWAMRKEDSSAKLNGARDKARDLRLQEYRRLLYVALTRAADALVVCGYLNKKQNEPEEGSWYNLVDSALAKDTAQITEHEVDYSAEKILRWGTPTFDTVAASDATPPQTAPELPDWLRAAWVRIGDERKRLRPSLTTRRAHASEATEGKGGRTRGILLHRLLQSLPELPASERETAAFRYLKQAAPELAEASQAALAAEALRVIADPACSKLFGPGSRAEPELIALIEDVEISARLDRIVVEGDEVIFADFKSDAAVPASEAAIPSHYVTQLAAYRAALLKTYPGKRIRALLVFTFGPRIFEIPEESLESAWRGRKTQGSPAFA